MSAKYVAQKIINFKQKGKVENGDRKCMVEVVAILGRVAKDDLI